MKFKDFINEILEYYQCDKCKSILTHKQMYDDNVCEDCYMDKQEEIENDK